MKKTFILFVAIAINAIIIAQTPSWQWAKRSGGTGYDKAYCVTTDSIGNVYMAGSFSSPTITFDTITLTNAGDADMFLVKYDNNQNVLWAKSAIGISGDFANSVSVDASGNIIVIGSFGPSSITFGTITLTNAGDGDVFIVKYDSSGNVLWAKSAGGVGGEAANSIVVDALGNSYMAGYFYSSTLAFDSTTLTNAGDADMFLVKYDSNGNVFWAKNAIGISGDFANSVSVDASGNSYVAGYFYSSTITFDSIISTNSGDWDMFLAKYDSSGNVVWAKSAGGSNEDRAFSVSVDPSGNILISGYFNGATIVFGTDTLTGWYDLFLVKYSPSGTILWAESAGGISADFAYSVSVDILGNSYITGSFVSSTITFGSTTLTNPGSNDIFIAKYDVSGNAIWAKSAGGNSYGYAHSVAIDATGNVFVAGDFEGPSIIFGYDTLTNAGTYDLFIAKLNILTRIAEETSPVYFGIYPNPNNGKFQLHSDNLQFANIKIYNVIGEIIYESKDLNSEINLSVQPKGIYSIVVTTQNKSYNKKLIIQ